jgi:tetratricopeptide (TPR) repeat protein
MASHKISALTFLFMICIIKNNAQDTLNSATVEQKSYQLYLDKQWPELITYGNKAVKKGFDYFYIQMRIGIAYYERKNYNQAEGHFKKALKFNSGDELALEYLYYCYIYNGRYDEARLLSKQFSTALAEKTGTGTQSSIGFVMLEGGSKKTDSATYRSADPKGKPNYFDPPVYFQLGLGHYLKNRISLFHAFTYFNQQTFISHVKQTQYYLKAGIPFHNGLVVSPSVHWVHLKNSTERMTAAATPTPGLPPPPRPQLIKTVTTNNYFVGSLEVRKTLKQFTLGLGTTVSNMNNVTQYIHSGSVSYSLLGNSKLFVGCTGYLHTVNSYKSTNVSVAPYIYTRPIEQASLKLSYLYNAKNNIIEDNGYLVNNSPDLTNSRYSALLNVTVSKRVVLYGLYQLEFKHEAVQDFNYRYNVFVAGIKFIP